MTTPLFLDHPAYRCLRVDDIDGFHMAVINHSSVDFTGADLRGIDFRRGIEEKDRGADPVFLQPEAGTDDRAAACRVLWLFADVPGTAILGRSVRDRIDLRLHGRHLGRIPVCHRPHGQYPPLTPLPVPDEQDPDLSPGEPGRFLQESRPEFTRGSVEFADPFQARNDERLDQTVLAGMVYAVYL